MPTIELADAQAEDRLENGRMHYDAEIAEEEECHD
jgi:hypothetical protein